MGSNRKRKTGKKRKCSAGSNSTCTKEKECVVAGEVDGRRRWNGVEKGAAMHQVITLRPTVEYCLPKVTLDLAINVRRLRRWVSEGW